MSKSGKKGVWLLIRNVNNMLHYEVWTTYSRAVDRDLFMDLFLKLTEYHSK